jgi:hypothetical protein
MITQENRSTETGTREELPAQPVLVASTPEAQAKQAQEHAWQLEAERRAAYVVLFDPCGLL